MAMTMYSWEKNYDRWDTEPDIVDEFVEDEIVTDEISLDDLADEEFELDESEFDLDQNYHITCSVVVVDPRRCWHNLYNFRF